VSLRIVFAPNAWQDYDGWLRRDMKMARRISKLIIGTRTHSPRNHRTAGLTAARGHTRRATTAPRGFRGLGPRSGNDEATWFALSANTGRHRLVEVPGIEPGSFVVLSGLLRAQLTMPLLGPTVHVSEMV
jgi:hypothetical protein